MKSGGPWNLRGLRPEAREAARTAARRSSMSVGEWLNDVIEPDDEDDEIALFADDDQEDDEVEYERSRRSRRRHRERRRARADRQAQQQVQQQQVEFERRVAKADRRQVQRQVEFERRVAQADRRHAEREDAFDREVVRTRSEIGAVSDRLERLSQQMERMASRAESAARRRPVAPPPPPPRQRPPFNGDQNHDARLTGAPASPRRSASERLAALPPAPAADNDSLSIDEAVAEIRARQRVLDGHAAPEPAVQLPPKPTAPAAAAPVEAAPAPAPMVQAAAPAPAPMPVAEPEPMFHYVPEPPVIDISGLEQQLRQITARIEGLKPSSDLE